MSNGKQKDDSTRQQLKQRQESRKFIEQMEELEILIWGMVV